MKILLTPDQWATLFEVTILDPDGWNRKTNFDEDFSTPIDIETFANKLSMSTILPRNKEKLKMLFGH